MPTRAEQTTFELHDAVCLAVSKDGYEQGTTGAVVDAYPASGRYTVELLDDFGETLDLVDCLAGEIRRARSGSSTNGRPQ